MPRGENHLADKLARAGGSKEPLPKGAFLEVIKAPPSKRPLMHVKYKHELCSLLTYILTYLIHI
jgi:hypothetical protein